MMRWIAALAFAALLGATPARADLVLSQVVVDLGHPRRTGESGEGGGHRGAEQVGAVGGGDPGEAPELRCGHGLIVPPTVRGRPAGPG